MIEKINANPIQDHFDNKSAGQPGRPKDAVNQSADATLQTEYASLIEKATKLPADEGDAVQRARELLQSGRLDNPANIRQAAEEIVKFGV